MKKLPNHLFSRLAVLFVLLLSAESIFLSCTANGHKFSVSTFKEVEEISKQQLGRLDPVIIRFTSPIALPDAITKAATFTPHISGTWAVRDERTVEFTPAQPYKSMSNFRLDVDTGVLKGRPAGIQGFSSAFSVRPSEYTVKPEGLYAEDDKSGFFTFSGTVATDIPVSERTVRGMITATLGKKENGKSLPLEWETIGKADPKKPTEKTLSYRFTIRHIARESTDRILTVAWKGDPVGSKDSGKQSWLVPAKQDFKVLEIAADDPACIQVRFSDRIDPAQDIRGLIRTGNGSEINVRYNIDSNVLKVYNTDGWTGGTGIKVLQGIKSTSGKTLMVQTSAEVNSNWEIPTVKFATDGVILPPNDGVIVPIETKNLRGLIVEAYQIYGDNILQFLQVNELDGSDELRRVGEPIWSKAFDFSWDDSMKNRYIPRGLDLSTLIKKHPDGMYQLRVTFRKRHIMYECPASHPDFSSLPMPSDEITADKPNEYSYWDYYGDMDWNLKRTYWEYENDPCHPAFYMYNYHNEIVARKNVLISNLGIMTKKDQDGSYYVTVADIASTAPVADADVVLYSYAKKELARAKTGSDGTVKLPVPGEGYFITASKAGQTSYLRIDEGTSLSVSHFEVDGEKAVKGIKGFIYGERGVWRPGDDIHLVFVLQDLAKQLPANFPVTFELQDPMGRIARSGIYTNAVDGFYRIDTSTGSDDSTGLWIARVKAGGQTWTRTVKIEMIVPNRLAINLKTSQPYLVAENNPFTLSGAWLNGAKAPNLKADVTAIFFPGSTSFDGYSDYTFINPERHVESERQTVWEGNLDEKSTASFNLDLDAGKSLPGKLRAQLITRIFEPSGMFSIEQANFDYSPYVRYVGIKLPKGDAVRGMLLTDTKHRMDIAVLDPSGKPVNANITLSVSVYKLQWRWWWEKDSLTDATYVSDRSTELITSGETTVKGGKGFWEFEIKYPEWGRYLVVAEDKSGGHSAAKIVYVDWPGWAGRSQESGSGSASMLTLIRDKTNYKTGETAQVSFSSGAGGRALVSVEKNGRVIRQDWLETAQGTTVYKLTLTPEMAPNVYVHITMLQKHMQTANSLPIRLYGVIPLMVEDPQTRLQPVVTVPAQFEPGKKASLSVSESKGRPMTYTVAVVDEGLLGLTRYTAPNPWNEFYKKEASLLASWDIYKYVMSAFGGKLETLLSVGGAEEGMTGNNKKAERFKPVVLFFGPFELKAGETKATDFVMPQYIGAVRVSVIAGKTGAYGTAEQTVPVKSDLMVLPTLPRTLGVNETIEVPVTLFNGRETPASVSVTLDATGAVTANLAQTVTIPAMENTTVNFRIATTTPGMATIKVKAVNPNAPAVADAAQPKVESITEIDILSRGSPVVTSQKFTVLPGEEFRSFVPSPGEKGTKTMSVELSSLPVLDLQTRLRYLVEYPHGCIEQITSGGFPQLYISDMIGMTTEETERIKKNVISVIDRYPRYQTTTGGFAYWPGEKEESSWGTNYAGHFMVEAKKAGYNVPDSLFSPWLKYQQDEARNWQPQNGENKNRDDAAIQAYRLYTLALSGNPELGAMNRLASIQNLPDTSRWLLAGSYALAGHQSTATDMTANLKLWPDNYRETGDTWGSNYRDSAIVLHMLNTMGDTRRAVSMVPTVANTFSSDYWYSTQETAWYLIALAPHYRTFNKTPATYSIEWDKGTTDGEIKRSAVIRELEPFDSPTQTLVVKNTGSKSLYGKVLTRGSVPAGKEAKIEKGLGLTVQYFDPDGNFIRASELKPGDSFSIRVGVTNMTQIKVENLALTVPVPTTWEFGNDRLGADTEKTAKVDSNKESGSNDDNEGDDGNSESRKKAAPLYDHQDIRDTQISTYFNLDKSETKVFTFYATVAYNGNYYVPATHVEAMYDGTYQAVLPGQFISRIAGVPAP